MRHALELVGEAMVLHATARSAALLFLTLMLCTGSPSAHADGEQPRVLVEEIVARDPTVPERGRWLLGGAGEVWYLNGPYDGARDDGTIEGLLPGASLYAGYDDWTLMGSYKSGGFNLNLTDSVTGSETIEEHDWRVIEGKIRYLFRDSRFLDIVPYVSAGINRTDIEDRTRLTTPNRVFTITGSPLIGIDTEHTSAVVGVGGILPFGDGTFGVRADVNGLLGYADEEVVNALPGTDSRDAGLGYGAIVHVTVYADIWSGIIMQVGGKFTYLGGTNGVTELYRTGFFGMLGYQKRF